jgi:ferrous-iron efflux pump FieF
MTAAHPSGLSLDRASALTRRITRLSLSVASALTAIKALAWILSGSVAMLASLADSGLDVLAAAVTFFAVRYAASPPDREHRYGHGKAEAFSSLTQAGLVFASGALVAEQAIPRLIAPHHLAYEGWDLGVMALSILLTAALVFAQSWTLRRAQSVAVEGDRMHYLADLASNLIAFAGIGASALLRRGEPDALAGIVIAGWLVWGAVGVFRRAAFELMDHELSDAARRRIVELMTEDPRVGDVHQLRTRAAGPYVHIQMHADLAPALSLVEAHKVVVAAERRVLNAFPAADIIIHPDPRGAAEPHGGAFPEVHEPSRERAAR